MVVERGEEIVAAVLFHRSARSPIFRIVARRENRAFKAPVEEVLGFPNHGKAGGGEALAHTVGGGVAVEGAVELDDVRVGDQVGNEGVGEDALGVLVGGAGAGLDERAVEVGAHGVAAQLDLEVIPAVVLDPTVSAGLGHAGRLQGVGGVAPAADVPKRLGGIVGRGQAEEGEEALGTVEFAGLEGERVVAPARVADQGAGVLVETGLAEHAVHDLPATAGGFPAIEALGKIALEERLVALGDLDVLELGPGGPGADAGEAGDAVFGGAGGVG